MQDLPEDLQLGQDRVDDTEVALPQGALLRHVMALGSSGSGKTVLCKIVVEEAVARGIPVIAVDPQGDLCSLALDTDTDDPRARQFRERADVVVFTPASRRGVPLCADPVTSTDGLQDGERSQAMTRTASMIVSLLGYDPASDDGAGLEAVLDRCLQDQAEAGRPLTTLEALSGHLQRLQSENFARYARYLDPKKIRTACQRLARLDVGARRLLFHDGIAINIDMLLGRDAKSIAAGKTRVSVIYLNTLHNQEDKDFFVAALVEQLYSWMLKNPSKSPQALFYIDEVAPFVPPVRKPACKDELTLLFKQARKYGVGCLMATQNPGDVDYKAMAQFGTWALGRLTTRQDQKKIEPTVKSLAPLATGQVMEQLPALRPGEFVLLSPDHFEKPVNLKTRQLYSAHETLDEARIEALADERWRDRFAVLDRTERIDAALDETVLASKQSQADDAGDDQRRADNDDDTTTVRAHKRLARKKRTARTPTIQSDESPLFDRPATHPSGAHSPELLRYARLLSTKRSMTTSAFAERASISEYKARSILHTLVATELAGHYRDGRQILYWGKRTGGRPDLGMRGKITAIVPHLDAARAESIAHEKSRSKVLGLLGDDESFEHAEMTYRLLYKVDFEERVKNPIHRRIVGPRHEERLGSVYIHPHTLDVLQYSKSDGIRFSAKPQEYASDVADFDGAAKFLEMHPGDLPIDEEDWIERKHASFAKQHFRKLFRARPRKVTAVFLPLWKLILRQGESSRFRVLTIDALGGRRVDWPQS